MDGDGIFVHEFAGCGTVLRYLTIYSLAVAIMRAKMGLESAQNALLK
jgi:hypothetical protein